MHHVHVEIALIACMELVAKMSGAFDDLCSMLRNSLTMEDGLRYLALLPMLRAIGGDHSVAEQQVARALLRPLLDEIGVLDD
jgi:thioredoxin-like negative regulator of GroEL